MPTPAAATTLRAETLSKFEGCTTIVSVPLILCLTGGRRWSNANSGLFAHLPLRLAVGVRPRTHTPALRMLYTRMGLGGEYRLEPPSAHDRFASAAAALDPDGAFDIIVASDAPEGYNVGVPGASFIALNAALSVDSGQARPDSLPGMQSDPDFRCRVLACTRSVRPGKVTGCSPSAVLAHGAVNLVRVEKDIPTVLPISELIPDLPPLDRWPVDLCVIAPPAGNTLGLPPELTLRTDVEQTLRRIRRKQPSALAPIPSERDALAAISTLRQYAFGELLAAWMDLLETRRREVASGALMDALYRRLAFLRSNEVIHPSISEVIASVERSLEGSTYGVLPLSGSTSYGGGLLIVTPAFECRHRLEMLEGVQPLYRSWLDGGAVAPMRLERHAASGMGIDGRAHRCSVLHGESSPVMQFVEHAEDLVCTVVVDAQEERVLVGGAGVSATDLPSQRMTAMVLALLLADPSQRIHSRDLPASAYRDSRAEFVSKIARPLSRTVERRVGKRLRLETHLDGTGFAIALERDPSVSVAIFHANGHARASR